MNISKNEISPEAALEAFADEVSGLMPKLCRAMVRYERNHITTGKLTVPQYWALELVYGASPRPMHELLRAMGLKSSTGTVFVDRLCRMGLVKRVRDQQDRRAVALGITGKGRRVIQDIKKQKRKGITELFRPLTAGERRKYLELMRKLAAEFERNQETLA